MSKPPVQPASFASTLATTWTISMHAPVCEKMAEPGQADPSTATPSWHKGELRLLGKLVKHFKRPAANQELIFAAFEEQGWQRCIDDPLPRVKGKNSKQRLHDAIDSMNRNQVNRLIRFRGNGKGTGTIWEPIADRSPTDRR